MRSSSASLSAWTSPWLSIRPITTRMVKAPRLKPKPKDLVVVVAIIAAGEFVDVDDVALQAEAERAAEYGHGLNDDVPTPSS